MGKKKKNPVQLTYRKNKCGQKKKQPKKKYQKALKKSKRNIILLFIVCLYVESIIVCAKGTIKNGTEKTKYGEYIYEDGALMAVRRNNYGILAKNVNECKVSTGGYGSSVFVKKSGKKNYVYEIGLKRNLFPKHIISQKAAEFYPIGNERIILADKNKKFIYRGEGRCFFLYTHKTEKECVASSGFCKKEKVLNKKWYDTTILKILSNPLYKGDFVSGTRTRNPVLYENVVEPIISKKLWEDCQEQTRKNTRNYTRRNDVRIDI